MDNVKHVLATGVVIREYPEDLPFPSLLILGYCDKIPLHVVFSLNDKGEKVLITSYWPDSALWNKSFNIKKY